MKNLVLTFAALIVLITSCQLNAQSNDEWTLEFRPGVDLATKDIIDAELGTGFGFEATIAYRFMPHLSAYAGWSWNHYSAEQSFAGTNNGFEETGYTFGLQFIHPVGIHTIQYIVRAGATYNHIEIENKEGDIIIDSGHGPGWQVETGLIIPVSNRFSLLPSVRYRSLNREIQVQNDKMSVDLNYISYGIGLSWSF